MSYLLDTHAALWYKSGDKLLSKTARNIIEDPDTVCFLSIVSLWEISIKISIGKLAMDVGISEFAEDLNSNGIIVLPITTDHLMRVSRLKFHHRDPFDRMIIAQALTEKYSIITMDGHFDKYKTKLIW